jgi:hypothetical protein
MSELECTDENKRLILDAYNKIKKYILKYIESDKTFYNTTLLSISYSFEVNK